MSLDDHPLRHQLAGEVHARPFPTAAAPGWAAFLALLPLREADHDAERAHLVALLDRFGAPHPRAGATH